MALSAPRPNMETVSLCKQIEEHETVKEWLERRPLGTQRNYILHLRKFCEFSKIAPEQFQELDPKSARDLVWSYLKTVLDRPSVASLASAALKSFYRNYDGVTLPFDGSKGGKHNIHKRRTKACIEHVPSKREVCQIIDMSASLRDKAMYLILFESGIRVNALLRLKYGHVREQLEKGTVPLHLQITDELDTKLRGYDLPFYDAFIGAEAVDTLKRYCETKHKDSTAETRLFDVKTTASVWMNFKRCIRRAGFDGKTMWVHSLRKAFKAELRKANIQEEISECLMGHRLKNSRENYMNRNDALNDLREVYEKADFSREGKSQEARHENEIQGLRQQLVDEREKTEGVSHYLDSLQTQIEDLQKRLAQLNGQQR
jgi:site-specific recombinase XerD